MIDSHCHLAGPEFAEDLGTVVTRAQQAGVSRCLVIVGAEDEEECARSAEVRSAWPVARFAVGVHPHHAARFADDPDRAGRVAAARLQGLGGGVAIGEIGLDYHYDFAPRDVQQAVFRAQLRAAREAAVPVIIHTRDADEDTLAIIRDEQRAPGGELRGVFHCFTGDRAAAARALATGFSLSFAGVVTFKAAEGLRDAAREVPDNRLLIETDSPYLAPVPFRGKRNEPAHVAKTFELLCAIRGVDPAVLSMQLVRNFDALFTPI